MNKIILIATMAITALVTTSCNHDDELVEVSSRYHAVSRTTEAEEKSAVPEGDERRPGESVEAWLKRLRWKLRNDILGTDR